MRPTRNIAVLMVLALLPPSMRSAHAVVVLPKGSDQPVMGYLVREDSRTIVVRQVLPGGKSRDIPFSKSDLEELIITVSRERLAELDPARPQLYREYAEELAEKQRDPEARDTAIRLYAIAAHRGDDKLRHSALLGLISLARTADEERRFRAAAYLYDSQHDATILVAPSAAPVIRHNLPRASPQLVSVFRLARQGKGSAAKAILDRPEVRAEVNQLSSLITLEDLAAACAARQLTSEQLQQLLKAELVLEGGAAPAMAGAGPAAKSATWSDAWRTGGLSPLPSVKLEALTEFDPTACIYREGKWMKP